jgi:uncharacterized protein
LSTVLAIAKTYTENDSQNIHECHCRHANHNPTFVLMHVSLLLLALLGHGFLWIGVVNRLHAVGIQRRIVSVLTLVFFLCASLLPVAIGAWFLARGELELPWASAGTPAGLAIGAYLLVCWIVAPVTLVRAVWLGIFLRRPSIVRFHRRRAAVIDPAEAAVSAEENRHHFAARLPLNEILRLVVAEQVVDVPRLAAALDGLSIVHLSDLHFTGRIGKAYFREVVRVANELHGDLIAVTGDIVDKSACVEWIADTLGQLSAPAGAHFILGNHDLRAGADTVCRELERCGLHHVGGRWRRIEIRGTPVVLAGNERPWIARVADMRDCPPPAPVGPLRIVLAHTPDQLAWARAHDADLLLTGHTHGGQICIPPLGAIFSPTFLGVKHISGVYHASPTIMQVSRGLSGDMPVRWNCPPEIVHLTLRAS